MSGRLVGTTALVTGASRGIGLSTAAALAREGARVAMVARTAPALSRAAESIGNGAVPLVCDLGDPGAARELSSRVTAALGGAPDVLVNNAGVFQLAELTEMEPSTFIATVNTNLVAPFLLIRAIAAAMRERGSGTIVGIGSIADRTVFPGNGAYSPAKYGFRAMHEILRAELHGSGVRVALVSPGAVDTALWDPVLAAEQPRPVPTRDDMLAADDVADAVLFAVTRPPRVSIDELRLSHS